MNRLLSSLFLVCSITSVAVAETVSVVGALEDGDILQNGGPVDIYKITLKENQSCKVTIQSNEFDGVMQYVTPAGVVEGKTKIEEDAQPVSIEIRAKPGEGGVYPIRISKRRVEAPAKYIIQFTSTEQIVDAILRPDGKLIGDPDHLHRPDRPNPLGGEEAVTVELKDVGTFTIPPVAFIDKGLSQSFGQKEPLDDGSRDITHATGLPDDKQFVLGKGGNATWQFVDNVMLDREGPDLLIWQSEGNESFEVWVSADGRGFQMITEVNGKGVIPVDLNGKFAPDEKLTFVKLVDTSLENNRWPGPDIDAIAAVHSGAMPGHGNGGGASTLKPVEYEDSKGIIHPLPLGEVAFVDESVSHDFGNRKPKGGSQNPDNAVGPINYDPKKKEEGYFSLGDKGNGVWKFLDNSLINGPGPDLLIFEIGEYEEPCSVEISEDGKTWIAIGEAAGETSAIDIGDKASADAEFFYVRLTDTKNRGGQWPGADVDAIAAINGRASNKSPDNNGQAAAAGNTEIEDWDKYIIPEILVGPVYPKGLSTKDQLGPDGSYTEFFRLDFLDVDPRTVSVASVRVSSTPDNRGGADGFEPRIHLYERSNKVPFIPSPHQNSPQAFPEPPVRYGVVDPMEATSTVVWSPAGAPPGYKDYIVAITSRNNNNLGSYKLEFKLGHFPPSLKEMEEKKEPVKALGN